MFYCCATIARCGRHRSSNAGDGQGHHNLQIGSEAKP
jgi:hypothetical protein